jgi:hypothetical protein
VKRLLPYWGISCHLGVSPPPRRARPRGAQIEIQREAAQADIQIKRDKAQVDIAIAQYKARQWAEFERFKAGLNAGLAQQEQ